MTILIKQARIISENSEYNGQTLDVLIEAGIIKEIKKTIQARGNVKEIEEKGLCLSEGWIDMHTVSCDPGFEHKENIDSLIKSAAAGGFTTVCVHNYNQPALHNKSQIEYILTNSQNKVVRVLPLGTITVNGKGKELAEMFDMKQSGAIAFSDYKSAINDSGTLLRALQYSSNIDSLIITYCQDESLSHGGQMNEGEISTALGLKGIPALAEELMIQRNLSILEYAGGKLHIPLVSSKGSVELIKKAKAAGLQVSCGISSVHLLLDDSALKDFDSNYKLNPPLRSKKDVTALRNAFENGTIDVLVSDHSPQDIESKDLEFDLAEFGMINQQTAFSVALMALKEKSIATIVNGFTSHPARILGLKKSSIAIDQPADITLFNLQGETILSAKNNLSRSRNSPFMNEALPGKVIGVINGSKSFFN